MYLLIGSDLIIGGIFLLIVGLILIFLFYITKKKYVDKALNEAEKKRKEIIESAEKDADQIKKEKLLEAKDEILTLRRETEQELKQKRRTFDDIERKLGKKESVLMRKEEDLLKKERELGNLQRELSRKEREIIRKEKEIDDIISEERRKLEKISGLSTQEAKELIVESLFDETRREATNSIKQLEEDARLEAERKAREIIAGAIQKCAADYVVESTVSTVQLPSDEMKGRIIGREGRNIRALETSTGVDLIVDDTPEMVILSSFDPYRREIAKVVLERLIEDGRIHPARIEEMVEKVKTEMEQKILEEGKNAAYELGVYDFHIEILKLLGKLKYRTSYGQNVLEHSKEVASIASAMASELGANVKVVKRAALIHDIGKAIDREVEGTHTQLGIEIAKKYGESPEIIHCIEAHHFDVDFETIEAMIVQAADAISAARPGARREILESYLKRLEELEKIACGFDGITKAYALQAGREIRIMVESEKISDEQAFWLAKDISKKIESELQYPGQIKVMVIRERRFVEYAK